MRMRHLNGGTRGTVDPSSVGTTGYSMNAHYPPHGATGSASETEWIALPRCVDMSGARPPRRVARAEQIPLGGPLDGI